MCELNDEVWKDKTKWLTTYVLLACYRENKNKNRNEQWQKSESSCVNECERKKKAALSLIIRFQFIWTRIELNGNTWIFFLLLFQMSVYCTLWLFVLFVNWQWKWMGTKCQTYQPSTMVCKLKHQTNNNIWIT